MFEVVSVTNEVGERYWCLYDHGHLGTPIALISDSNMKQILKAIVPANRIVIPSAEDLTSRVRNYRKEKQIDQETFAKLVGVSRNRISQIENGHANVTLDTLRRLTDVLEE